MSFPFNDSKCVSFVGGSRPEVEKPKPFVAFQWGGNKALLERGDRRFLELSSALERALTGAFGIVSPLFPCQSKGKLVRDGMAAPYNRWMLVVALLWLLSSSTAVAEPFQHNKKQSSPWELAITGPTCDPSTPVCGEGGINFESSCHAIIAGVRIRNTGVCAKETKQAASCNIICFRADPVCGEDALTYWCGAAEAKCAGVKVAYIGYCDPRSGGSGKKGTRAAQSLFLVHLLWLVFAGFLVIADVL